MDTVSKERRSEIMGLVKARNTRPEVFVRRLFHRLGYRFRLHPKNLPGGPDFALPRHRVAVFVHGCFWHRHPGCPNTRTPKSRVEFWEEKFQGNMRRDKRARRLLSKAGWRVLVVWECELVDTEALAAKIQKFMGGTRCGPSSSSRERAV